MALHGGAGVITLPEGSIREAERIIRRAPLRKQFNRAPEVLDRRFLAPVRGGDPAEHVLPDRLRLWIRDERAREPPALVDPAGFEKRVSEFHTRRCEVGIQGDGTLQLFRGLRVPGEPLQDHAVEIVPLVGSRRERLRASVGVVRGVPLLPCMEHACQLSRRLGIRRPRAGITGRPPNHLPRGRGKQVDRRRRRRRRGLPRRRGLRESRRTHTQQNADPEAPHR